MAAWNRLISLRPRSNLDQVDFASDENKIMEENPSGIEIKRQVRRE